MEQRGPWMRYATEEVWRGPFFQVRSDRVTTPGGAESDYSWVEAPDLVRVAARTAAGEIYVVRQHHYLPDRPGMWQLPGGGVGDGETPEAAAARELHEEVGATGTLKLVGSVWPMPGLTASRTHLFVAGDLRVGDETELDESEADLVAFAVPLSRAVAAALDGTIGCAPSAQLVLSVALTSA
ncbi:NUDIX hydrolase [Paractinoplanes ferrugineus]|uniref:ADP-ribose pyrophosphatase n=1 Tax=Paractinoplanes ferrugineus TaxID=113564 RepID=A0A919IZ40_9ACTN|nr:NUDIX hydrolase [Actinoplanes ferrugineus]GIE09958.1 ADP-ribose pyrophosphatase [Actinoplanes ferrugineus]